MRGSELDKLSGDTLDRWFRRTPDEIEQERRQAEAAGRQAYERAARTGRLAVARTQSELRTLGRQAQNPATWREAAMQADAGVRGAADALTFGTADEIAAGLDAFVGIGGRGNISQRYQANVQKERARDAYDAEHRRIARGAGELAGNALLYLGSAKAGVRRSANLSPAAKGKLGEAMSQVKTVVTGDWPVAGRKRISLSGDRYSVADQLTARSKIVESKFGPTARLSPRQRQAQVEYGPRYRVDRWLPEHVGYATGTGAVGAGAIGQAIDDDR